jgi:oligopeptide/dipeptide ABC transporter ATP-binding protein
MITHDLGVARYFCEDVMVMYAGRVMERATTLELLDRPRHPYSVGLLGSSIEVGGRDLPLIPIPGSPPDLARRPAGCPFHPRCSAAELPRCTEPQEMIKVETGAASDLEHGAACWKAASLV